MQTAVLMKTAAMWCRELGYSILDPDGWRYENGAIEFFETPVTQEEFMQKLNMCTAKRGFEQLFEDRMQAMRQETTK